MRYTYWELKEGEKVVKRMATSIAREHKDRRMLERFQKPGQEINYVVSSTKERVIN